MRAPARLPVYAGAGFVFEAAFSALHDVLRGRRVTLRTSPWMLAAYALLLPLYEPVHDAVRDRPLPVRASVYGAGFLAVEYASGLVFRRLLGDAPWDYTYAKRHVNGLVRPDYFFLWALAGMLCERLHDALLCGPAEATPLCSAVRPRPPRSSWRISRGGHAGRRRCAG